MSRRQKSILALLESATTEELIFNFISANQRRPHIEALAAGLVNATRENVEFYAACGAKYIAIQRYEVSLHDSNHPLITVLRNGTSATWQTLHRGVRIEDTRFRRFVSELPGECGLFASPIFDKHGLACGVVAAFSRQPELCGKAGHAFSLSSQLFGYQMKNLLELQQLRLRLRQVQEVFREQQQRQQQLDKLLSELSSAETGKPADVARDYSGINDLNAAVEVFEGQVLAQRMRQLKFNKVCVAKSLSLSLRALNYKLGKYGCGL